MPPLKLFLYLLDISASSAHGHCLPTSGGRGRSRSLSASQSVKGCAIIPWTRPTEPGCADTPRTDLGHTTLEVTDLTPAGRDQLNSPCLYRYSAQQEGLETGHG